MSEDSVLGAEGALPDSHAIPFVVLMVTSALLSMLGSGCIVWMARRDLEHIQQRLLFGMSLYDVIASASFVFLPFLLPKELNVWGASGNQTSCAIVGFVGMSFFAMSSFYHGCLSVYFLATIRYNWKETRLTTWEVVLHGLVFAIPTTVMTVAAAKNTIKPNQASLFCLVTTYPWGCEDIETLECVNDEQDVNAIILILGTFYSLVALVGVCCTFMVYLTVRNKLNASKQFIFRGTTTATNGEDNNPENADRMQEQQQRASEQQAAFDSRIREVWGQALCYVVVYLNTVIWPAVVYGIGDNMTAKELQDRRLDPGLYILHLLTAFFAPFQGALNYLVYTRQDFRRWRKVEPGRSWLWIARQILNGEKVHSRQSTHRNHGTSTRPSM